MKNKTQKPPGEAKTKTPERKLTLPRNAKSNPDDIDNLYLAFLSTTEMQDWTAFVEQARKGIASGKNKIEVPADFLKLVIEDIASTPLSLDAVVEVWNRVCDQEGMPQEKKNTPGPEEPGRPGGENDGLV
jgi:hypothetical protein